MGKKTSFQLVLTRFLECVLRRSRSVLMVTQWACVLLYRIDWEENSLFRNGVFLFCWIEMKVDWVFSIWKRKQCRLSFVDFIQENQFILCWWLPVEANFLCVVDLKLLVSRLIMLFSRLIMLFRRSILLVSRLIMLFSRLIMLFRRSILLVIRPILLFSRSILLYCYFVE